MIVAVCIVVIPVHSQQLGQEQINFRNLTVRLLFEDGLESSICKDSTRIQKKVIVLKDDTPFNLLQSYVYHSNCIACKFLSYEDLLLEPNVVFYLSISKYRIKKNKIILVYEKKIIPKQNTTISLNRNLMKKAIFIKDKQGLWRLKKTLSWYKYSGDA